MQPGPPNAQLTCSRCGATLEMPVDLRATHCDCPYCGLDNVLPPHVIDARRHQLLELERQQAAAQAQADQARKRAEASKTAGQVAIGLGVMFVASIGSCGVLAVMAQRQSDERGRKAKDLIAVQFAELRKKGCDRVVVAPEANREKVSLDLVDTGPCVHLVAVAGAGGTVKISGSSISYLAPAAAIDHRACAHFSGKHNYEVTGHTDPFAVGAIECPRLPTERGVKTKEDDLKKLVSKRVEDLEAKGCTNVIQETTVGRASKNFRVSFEANDDCYNFLIGTASEFTRFNLSLTDASGTKMPVPDPAREMRLIHCPTKAGDYTLTIKPTYTDEYAYASLECPRNGREGLQRERELRSMRGKTGEVQRD
jgi:hypothetical protein